MPISGNAIPFNFNVVAPTIYYLSTLNLGVGSAETTAAINAAIAAVPQLNSRVHIASGTAKGMWYYSSSNEWVLESSNTTTSGTGGGPNSVTFLIENADLVGHNFIATHNLNSNSVDVTVREPDGEIIYVPSTILGSDSVSISFEGITPITGIYSILVEA